MHHLIDVSHAATTVFDFHLSYPKYSQLPTFFGNHRAESYLLNCFPHICFKIHINIGPMFIIWSFLNMQHLDPYNNVCLIAVLQIFLFFTLYVMILTIWPTLVVCHESRLDQLESLWNRFKALKHSLVAICYHLMLLYTRVTTSNSWNCTPCTQFCYDSAWTHDWLPFEDQRQINLFWYEYRMNSSSSWVPVSTGSSNKLHDANKMIKYIWHRSKMQYLVHLMKKLLAVMLEKNFLNGCPACHMMCDG